MLLLYLNKCVIKLLHKTLSFFTAFIKLYSINYTYRGYLKTILTKLQYILIECDLIYDKVFLRFSNLPLRYQVPDLQRIIDKLTENTKLENICCMLKLNVDVKKYIHICQVVDSTLSQNMYEYNILCKDIFRHIPDDALHFIINIVDYKQRKTFLEKMSNSSGLVFNIQYSNCGKHGDTFYKQLDCKINDINFKLCKNIS